LFIVVSENWFWTSCFICYGVLGNIRDVIPYQELRERRF
jgi:hypothetical protein